jgi:hypothetical protein
MAASESSSERRAMPGNPLGHNERKVRTNVLTLPEPGDINPAAFFFMADELPPAPSESADEAAKAETIRITLPAKPETPTAKRETVRINLPGKSGVTPIPPAGVSPKKETTKLSAGIATPEPAAAGEAPAAASRPFMPPPPKPPSQASVPVPPSKPMSGAVPPKPPSLSKPTVPLKPAPAPTASGVRPAPAAPMKAVGSGIEPVTQKAAAPKKETARITLPPEGTKPAMPKATVKMQQTQPLVRQPVPSTIQTAPAIQTAAASTSSTSSPENDPIMNVLAIAAFIVSLAAAVLSFLAYSGASLAS